MAVRVGPMRRRWVKEVRMWRGARVIFMHEMKARMTVAI